MKMKKKILPLEAATRYFMIMALAASILSSGGCTSVLNAQAPAMAGGNTGQQTPNQNARQPARGNEAGPIALMGIIVSFKLDFRMNGPTYGGERWVSPPTFTFAQGGSQLTIEAKAQGVDTRGRPIELSPTWIPEDAEFVTVLPSQGNEVKITVRGPGQSRLKVALPGLAKELSIKATATQAGKALQVDISQ